MKVVLDTDVMVAALRSSSGASRRLLLDVVDGRLNAVISVPLILEYEAVLKRPAMLKAMGLTAEDMDEVLNMVAASMDEAPFHFLWRPQVRDPSDDMVLETAVNGQADIIVTFNVNDFGDVPQRFGIACQRPGDLLRRLKGTE